jgi:glycosyltransferase involved in cell wall biosynthesis
LVHDYLTQYGGAERVLEQFHELWPDAPIFTALYDPAALPPHWQDWDIRESWLGRIPGARRNHRRLVPLYPLAFRSFGRALGDYDVILSDTSAWAHQASARGGSLHIAYCHSPARFLWRDDAYLEPAALPGPVRALADGVFAVLRGLDRRSAQRLDTIIANSATVAKRIRAAWGRDSTVIYPPVTGDRFVPPVSEPDDFYLVVSRLVPHKRIDLAVAAFTTSGRPLRIVGTGPESDRLRLMAGPCVSMLGALPDSETIALMRRCRALILPGREDFGITAVEAQAAGRPVIAFGEGGATESIIDGRTGVLFREQTVAAVNTAVVTAEGMTWSSEACVANAHRFHATSFRAKIETTIRASYDRHVATQAGSTSN